jgi:hypothetical protein
MIYDHAVSASVFYVYESTNPADRVIYQSHNWFSLKQQHSSWHAYVSLHWTN